MKYMSEPVLHTFTEVKKLNQYFHLTEYFVLLLLKPFRDLHCLCVVVYEYI